MIRKKGSTLLLALCLFFVFLIFAGALLPLAQRAFKNTAADVTQQQAEYQALFRRYALALYKTFPLDFADSLSYEVGQAYEEDGYTVVAATVHVELSPNNPQDFLLQFRLRSVDGGIKLVDIKLAESSLILSYRSKFYKMIAADDGEMSWFLEDLQAMTEAAERNNQALLPPE